MLSIKTNVNIVLVYDTDVIDDSKLIVNLEKSKKNGFKNIIHIQSIKNFEDELVFSSIIKNVHEMFNTQGIDEFKNKFIHCSNIIGKLVSVKFEKNNLWIRNAKSNPFSKYKVDKKSIIK